jgi:WD40 repeat protein
MRDKGAAVMLVLKGAYGDVSDLAFSPNVALLAATGNGRGLEIWNLPSGTKWAPYKHALRPNDGPIAFHPTHPVCFASRGICVMEIATDTREARQLVINGASVYSFLARAMLPDGSRLISFTIDVHPSNGSLRLLRWEPGKQLTTIWKVAVPGLVARSSQAPQPLVICVAADGATFFTLDAKPSRSYWSLATELTRVSVWSVERGEHLRSAKLPAGTVSKFALSPDSRMFATCRTNALSIWNAADLKVTTRLQNDTKAHFTAVAFHPSGRYLAATSNDMTVKLYDTTTWKIVYTFTWKIGRLRSVAFSPDGTLAAVGSEMGQVVVWDVDL